MKTLTTKKKYLNPNKPNCKKCGGRPEILCEFCESKIIEKLDFKEIGCKFCYYRFNLTETQKYINHLWRFHRDDLQEKLNTVIEEINRLEKAPK